ncbi:hypothetical protein GCM10023096_60310 [Nonomuraea ferruginea]
MGIDRHGDLDVAVADDLGHDVRRDAEVQEEAHAGVPHVVKAYLTEAGGLTDGSPASVGIVGFHRRSRRDGKTSP